MEEMKKIEEIYNDFEKRIDSTNWIKILEREKENKNFINLEIIKFLKNNHNIPQRVWRELGNFFQWRDNAGFLENVFPKVYVEQLLNNMSSKDILDYDLVPKDLGKKTDEFINYYSKAYEEICNNQIYKAERNINKAKEIYKDHLDLMLLEAKASRLRYDKEGALSIVNKVLTIDRKKVEANIDKAMIYIVVGELESAYDILKGANELWNYNYDIKYQLAKVALNLEKYEEALDLYLELYYCYPYIEEIKIGLESCANFIVDELEEKAITKEGKLKLAKGYLHIHKSNKAYDIIKNLQENNHKEAILMIEIAIADERYVDAMNYCENTLKQYGENYETYFYIGEIYCKKKQKAKAIEYYNKSIKLNESCKRIYMPLIQLYIEESQYMKANELLDILMDEGFNLYEVWKLKGDILYNENKEEALVFYDKALNLNSGNVEAYANKSKTLRKFNRLKEANNICELALERGITGYLLYLEKAYVFIASSMYEDAIYWLDAAIDIDYLSAEAIFQKGISLININNASEGEKYLRQAVQIDKSYENKILEFITPEEDVMKCQ